MGPNSGNQVVPNSGNRVGPVRGNRALRRGLAEYFEFYNVERSHQALDYQKPDDVYYGRPALKAAA